MKQVIRNAMQPRGGVPAKGIKVTCSGRLAGADIARVMTIMAEKNVKNA